MNIELKLDLHDTEWQYEYVDHDRNIARAIVYDEAVKEYENRANTKLGKLIANRELPVLFRAKEIIDAENKNKKKSK